MYIPLIRENGAPLYRQIVDYIREEIESGVLPGDTRLPSTRDLAASIGVNRITVNNAYAELEAEGLIYSRLGSGTFVAARVSGEGSQPGKVQWPQWQTRLAQRSTFHGALATSAEQGQGRISFSSGTGAIDLFPIEDFRRAIQMVLARDQKETLSYGPNAGYAPLRATISQILADQGILTRPENIVITTGSQQALWLVMNMLLRPGDTALVESPTYAGVITLLRALEVQLVSVPVDQDGMQVDRVEELLQTIHPDVIYTIPTFHNPTGTCMSGIRRRQLIELAGRFNVPIVEDEFVGDLRYEGRSLPSLKSLDPGGRVIFISTFSKVLMPGLRVGYIAANGPVIEQLEHWKEINDVATSNLLQRALEAYITVGRYQSHLHRATRLYRANRDQLLAALTKYMPAGMEWLHPQGGLFLWLRLPGGVTASQAAAAGLEEGVDVAIGSPFFPEPSPAGYLRLKFAAPQPDQIDEGILRLSRAVRRCLSS